LNIVVKNLEEAKNLWYNFFMAIKFERPSFRNRKDIKERGKGFKKEESWREEKSGTAAKNFNLSDELERKKKELSKKVGEIEKTIKIRNSGEELLRLAKERAEKAKEDAEEKGKKSLKDYWGGK
jgi:hypothetical protein